MEVVAPGERAAVELPTALVEAQFRFVGLDVIEEIWKASWTPPVFFKRKVRVPVWPGSMERSPREERDAV